MLAWMQCSLRRSERILWLLVQTTQLAVQDEHCECFARFLPAPAGLHVHDRFAWPLRRVGDCGDGLSSRCSGAAASRDAGCYVAGLASLLSSGQYSRLLQQSSAATITRCIAIAASLAFEGGWYGPALLLLLSWTSRRRRPVLTHIIIRCSASFDAIPAESRWWIVAPKFLPFDVPPSHRFRAGLAHSIIRCSAIAAPLPLESPPQRLRWCCRRALCFLLKARCQLIGRDLAPRAGPTTSLAHVRLVLSQRLMVDLTACLPSLLLWLLRARRGN